MVIPHTACVVLITGRAVRRGPKGPRIPEIAETHCMPHGQAAAIVDANRSERTYAGDAGDDVLPDQICPCRILLMTTCGSEEERPSTLLIVLLNRNARDASLAAISFAHLHTACVVLTQNEQRGEDRKGLGPSRLQ